MATPALEKARKERTSIRGKIKRRTDKIQELRIELDALRDQLHVVNGLIAHYATEGK